MHHEDIVAVSARDPRFAVRSRAALGGQSINTQMLTSHGRCGRAGRPDAAVKVVFASRKEGVTPSSTMSNTYFKAKQVCLGIQVVVLKCRAVKQSEHVLAHGKLTASASAS